MREVKAAAVQVLAEGGGEQIVVGSGDTSVENVH